MHIHPHGLITRLSTPSSNPTKAQNLSHGPGGSHSRRHDRLKWRLLPVNMAVAASTIDPGWCCACECGGDLVRKDEDDSTSMPREIAAVRMPRASKVDSCSGDWTVSVGSTTNPWHTFCLRKASTSTMHWNRPVGERVCSFPI
jgi:hypothetical protein